MIFRKSCFCFGTADISQRGKGGVTLKRNFWTRVLALMLVFTAVFSLTGNPTAAALEHEPYMYRYSGGEGTYTLGEEIKVVYKYSPCYRYEYTYCELYDANKEKLATSKHSWTNSSTTFKTWTVNIDTKVLKLDPGTYYLKSYVYYKYNYQYITASVEWSTFKLKSGASIELNRSKYNYTVSYIKTEVPKKTITLKADVDGSDSPVSWSSSDKSVATVNSKGKVTMKGLGTCVITATVDGVSDSCKITVKKQTGTAYYKKFIKEHVEEVIDCFDVPFENVEDMREKCDEALEEAVELKAEINKVKLLKKDSQVKKMINVLLTNVRKADDLAWVDGISITDPQMILYVQTIQKYTNDLDARIKTLVKE